MSHLIALQSLPFGSTHAPHPDSELAPVPIPDMNEHGREMLTHALQMGYSKGAAPIKRFLNNPSKVSRMRRRSEEIKFQNWGEKGAASLKHNVFGNGVPVDGVSVAPTDIRGITRVVWRMPCIALASRMARAAREPRTSMEPHSFFPEGHRFSVHADLRESFLQRCQDVCACKAEGLEGNRADCLHCVNMQTHGYLLVRPGRPSTFSKVCDRAFTALLQEEGGQCFENLFSNQVVQSCGGIFHRADSPDKVDPSALWIYLADRERAVMGNGDHVPC